jgi:hypothetical protein
LVSRGRLTHIEDREGTVFAVVRGGRRALMAITSLLGERLWSGEDDRLRGGILRVLDDEVARFDEVVSVVEELAEHVFRGRAEARVLTYGYRTRYEYTPPSRDYPYARQHILHTLGYGKAALRTILTLELTINTDRRSASLRATADVELLGLWPELRGSEDGRLFIAFLDELAGVFGVRGIRFGSAELYSRRRVVR